MEIRRIDVAQAAPASPQHFDGRVRMQRLYDPARDGEESELVAVFFDAGARTRPHTHACTQVLHVVSGRCVIVVEDERRVAGSGECVIIPPGVWHWHGATPDGPACHISVKLPGRTNWDVPAQHGTDG